MNIVNFSGGKDSTALLLLMREKGIKIDRVNCADTGVEFPGIEENILQVKELLERDGVEFNLIKPERSFEELACQITVNSRKYGQYIGYGSPTWGTRWCTRAFKRDTLKKFKTSKDDVVFVGIAADEKERIEKKYLKKGNFRLLLVEENMTEKDCLEYCYKRGFRFGEFYERYIRGGCWCCPLQRNDELYRLYKEYPDLFRKLVEMQKVIKKNTEFCNKSTHYPLWAFGGRKGGDDLERWVESYELKLAQKKK